MRHKANANILLDDVHKRPNCKTKFYKRTFLTKITTNYSQEIKKLHGLSPRANYTDRATAACRRSDCQLLEGYRVPRGQCDGSLRPYSRFARQEPLLFSQVAPQLYLRGRVDPVPDLLLFLFFLVVPGIEPGPPDL
jgi:hypothetical protein